MWSLKSVAATAACSALLCAAVLRADEPASAPAAAPAAAAPAPLLNQLLTKMGAEKTLDDWNVSIHGYAEVSYTYDLTAPEQKLIPGRIFDAKNNAIDFNQANLQIERDITSDAKTKNQFYIGGKLDMMYGSDAGYIHAPDLDASAANNPYANPRTASYDLTQAYVEMWLPIGHGVDLKAGKFVTLLGQETINPTSNVFYSHSYLFNWAIPLTQTGVIATYAVNDKLTVTGGAATRGWNVSTTDNNSAIDFLGAVSYAFTPTLAFTENVSIGPQATHDDSHYFCVFDSILTYTNGPWTFALNGDFGEVEKLGPGHSNVNWYGIAGYASYTLNSMLTPSVRLEWFRDEEGFVVGGPAAPGIPVSYAEGTVGVSITPWPDNQFLSGLKFRPEFRVDNADGRPVFGKGNNTTQETVAMDVILTY